jgi:hypothetical protein
MARLPELTIGDFDLTAVYYTANAAPEKFTGNTWSQLIEAFGRGPIVVVAKNLGEEGSARYAFTKFILADDTPRSQAAIYRQVLEGAKAAKTKYVACCEDDVLYSPEHFKFRPKPGHWGYNMNSWNLYTWGEPMFSYKAPGGRRNLNGLVCERQMLIDHLEERFRLWPDDSKIDIRIFGEPGKYDNQLGTTPYPSQDFYTNPPNIVFSHQANLQFEGLGTRKALGQIRATSIPYWGEASKIRELYA